MTRTKETDAATAAWETATWEGSRREQLRQWAELPLERILAAQEEMHELARAFGATQPNESHNRSSHNARAVHETN